MKWRQWQRTWALSVLSAFKYQQVCLFTPTHLPTHTKHRVYDDFKMKGPLIKPCTNSSIHVFFSSHLTILTVGAACKWTCEHINLSMSFSRCSSCSVVVMVLHCLISTILTAKCPENSGQAPIVQPRENPHQPAGVKDWPWLTVQFKLDLH